MTTKRNPFGPVLIGMRGSGKSTVGRIAAERLGIPFMDADDELVRRAGMEIPRIFEARGEEGFRAMELDLLEELLARKGTVVATGGGAVLHPEVRSILARRFTAWLNASMDELARRIAGSGRPSLTGRPPEQELPDLWARRRSLYRECAHQIVDTGALPPDEAARRVIEGYRAWTGAGPD